MCKGKRGINWTTHRLSRSVFALFVVSLALGISHQALAQTHDLVDLLVRQRIQARSAEILNDIGTMATPRDVAHLDGILNLYIVWMERSLAQQQATADSLAAVQEAMGAEERASALVDDPLEVSWRKYAADEQGDFLNLYSEAFWRAVGTPHPLDTLHTPALRAKLNGLVGAPTRNAAAREQEGYTGSEYVQFEYWLEVNEEIPVLVMDTEGPFGRGVLLAVDEAHVEHFADIKLDLFGRLDRTDPVPYADYFHSRDDGQWFRTGYDGEAYFTRETRRPRWASRTPRDEKWRIFR